MVVRKNSRKLKTARQTDLAVLRALRRAGRVARKTARMYGTPVYYERNGKIVAEKP
jgi:hypothetical protein